MPWAILALIVIITSAAAIIALERWRPYDRGQPFLRDGFWIDLVTYALFQSYFLGLVINLLIGWIDGWTGASWHGLVSGWSIASQVAFFVISHDLFIYWFHRLQHGNRWLWRLHEAHHSARQVDWIAGSRSHSFEILINQSIELGAMILLGASVDAILIKGAISAVWGMWIHANVDVRSGRLQWVINGPEMHRWHHAIDHHQGGATSGRSWRSGTGSSVPRTGRRRSRPGTGSPRRTRGGTWNSTRSRSGQAVRALMLLMIGGHVVDTAVSAGR